MRDFHFRLEVSFSKEPIQDSNSKFLLSKKTVENHRIRISFLEIIRLAKDVADIYLDDIKISSEL